MRNFRSSSFGNLEKKRNEYCIFVGELLMFRIPHLKITRIYYRLVVENIDRFSIFPEAGIRGAMGYYLYDEIKKDFGDPRQRENYIQLYRALLGPLPGERLPPDGPQPRSINLRFFDLPQEKDKMGLEVVFFGQSCLLSESLEQSLVALGEEGIGRWANRFYIDGVRPPVVTDIADIVVPEGDRAKLVFFSPTSFRHNREECKDWNLEMFSWNLLQRIELLCKAYGDMDGADWDFDGLLQDLLRVESQAKTIKTLRSRLSSRQNKRIDYSGFTGTVLLEHVSRDAFVLLSVGEALGVGKNTTFGGGRYVIERK